MPHASMNMKHWSFVAMYMELSQNPGDSASRDKDAKHCALCCRVAERQYTLRTYTHTARGRFDIVWVNSRRCGRHRSMFQYVKRAYSSLCTTLIRAVVDDRHPGTRLTSVVMSQDCERMLHEESAFTLRRYKWAVATGQQSADEALLQPQLGDSRPMRVVQLRMAASS